MKVVHIVRQFAPSIGGLEDSVQNLATGLKALGHDIRIVTLDRIFNEPETALPARSEVAGLPVERIPYRGSKRYPVAPSVLAHVRDADLVHVHAIDFFFDYMAWTRPLHGKPMVASTHGGFFHTEYAATAKKVWFQTITRSSSRAYRALICGSDNDAATFRRIAAGKVDMIQTGVNVGKLADAASPEHRRTLIYFGRLSPNKQIGRLFPLLAQLRAVDPEWRLILAGSVWDMKLEQLQGEMAAAGVTDHVRHVDKPSDEQLRTLIGQASYFVSASSYEGFGITAVEAMSAGLMPVLSAIPTFRDLIERTGDGVLFDPGDPRGAAEKVLECSRRFEERQDGTRSHMKEVAAAYAWPAVAARFDRKYREVLTGNPL